MNIPVKIKNYTINTVLTVVSISFALLFAEAVVRRVVDPVDYLAPYIVYDEKLGRKVVGGSAAHDAWGYRNKSVPTASHIVTIGDSLTYGVSAAAKNSWPSQLQRMTQKSVYNLALGGYGPAQYLYLLEQYALQLRPAIVIAGFYYGNDLYDSYRDAYTKDYWKYLRSAEFVREQFGDQDRSPEIFKRYYEYTDNVNIRFLRSFLSHNSVIYRATTYAFSDILQFIELKYFKKQTPNNVTIFEEDNTKIRTGFYPHVNFERQNINDDNIKEGLRISIKLFSDIQEICKKNNITFVVLLIPTKENVFSNFIEKNNTLKNSALIDKLIMNEKHLNALVKHAFKDLGILHVDPLENLRHALKSENIYPPGDDHPNKHGYEIIAMTVHQFLQSSKVLGALPTR